MCTSFYSNVLIHSLACQGVDYYLFVITYLLKAGVDLDFLPPGKKGGVKSPSLAVLLIRTAVN